MVLFMHEEIRQKTCFKKKNCLTELGELIYLKKSYF